MGLDRVLGDVQLGGYLGVRQPAHDRAELLPFPFGQLGWPGGGPVGLGVGRENEIRSFVGVMLSANVLSRASRRTALRADVREAPASLAFPHGRRGHICCTNTS